MNEDGIAVNTGFKRFYFQTNNSIKLLPQLTLNTNISYEHNIRSGAFGQKTISSMKYRHSLR